jgi:adenosine kinase
LRILITGSIAYDTIMVFRDRFKNHLLEDQLHILNVCFVTPEMRREFGGCAGNIAYNLRLLGAEPVVFGAVGEDIAPYLDRLKSLDIDSRHIARIAGQFTAQAFITTDLDDNQITAFHPGAMDHAHIAQIGAGLNTRMAIIAPDGRQGMIEHARQCVTEGIPYLFDPGQQLPMFSKAELERFIDEASYLAVNDYEGKMLEEKTGLSLEKIAAKVKALVVTLGGEGSLVYEGETRHVIQCVKAESVQDPTGCGDAYRAGMLYGIASGWDIASACRLGSVMGSFKIAARGPQNHRPTRGDIESAFRSTYDYSPWSRG